MNNDNVLYDRKKFKIDDIEKLAKQLKIKDINYLKYISEKTHEYEMKHHLIEDDSFSDKLWILISDIIEFSEK